MNELPEVIIVKMHDKDWEMIYVDGDKKIATHPSSIRPEDVLRLVGIKVTVLDADD